LQQPFEQTVVNYNKNGEIYICLIKGFPVFNIKGKLSHFIAFERRHKKIPLVEKGLYRFRKTLLNFYLKA
jgi:hypothetical protein